MFKRRSKQSEDEFDDYAFDGDLEQSGRRGALPGGLVALLVILIVLGVLAALDFLGYQFWRSSMPV